MSPIKLQLSRGDFTALVILWRRALLQLTSLIRTSMSWEECDAANLLQR